MKKVIVFGMSLMLLGSCNNSTEKSTTHQETENHTEHQHDESSEAIELNNGEKVCSCDLKISLNSSPAVALGFTGMLLMRFFIPVMK